MPVDTVPNGAGLLDLLAAVPYGVGLRSRRLTRRQDLLVQKLAPALITRNAVVIKPCLEGTAIAQAIAKAFTAGGVPRGLVQVLPGDREEALGLAAHPDVDVVTLTGGTAAGDYPGEGSRREAFIGELGGNSPQYSSCRCRCRRCCETHRSVVVRGEWSAMYLDAADHR